MSYAKVVYSHQSHNQFMEPKKPEKNIAMSWMERKEEREWLSKCAIGSLSVFSNFVNLSEDRNPVDLSWVNHHLGILNEDSNLNPMAERENEDSLEDIVAVTTHSKYQEKDKQNMGVADQWKGECSKSVGPDFMKHAQSKILPEGPTQEFSQGQEENQPSDGNETQIQNMDTLDKGTIDGLQDNNIDMGQMVVYAHPTETFEGYSSGTQIEERVVPASSMMCVKKLKKKEEASEFVQAANRILVLKKKDSNFLKTHNMQTRSSKKGYCRKVAADGELVVNKVSWNLDDEMARVVEETVRLPAALPPTHQSSRSYQVNFDSSAFLARVLFTVLLMVNVDAYEIFREGYGSSIGLGIFNKEDTRKALAKMLIVDELPFRFVKKRGFCKFCRMGMARWNSTYLMLASALKFVKAFNRLDDEDGYYHNYFKETENGQNRIGPPNFEHWENAKTIEKQDNIRGRNKVERYLLEPVERKRSNFDIFTWWSVSSAHYSILASIAKDVFAMSISTVA
ncbi:hypothetical protein EZV62_001423 [Acer yangbiense]|uniref:HAT C-terminal dimerisation domain-containing protein n=1 Tax=Acer yangbiense TaxID=1000413 RepID=A0A5C7IVF3_9ROSI|nr:hypothetical protein EZV62_001423 [Acer yangbiense]